MWSECSYLIELAQPSQLKDYFSWVLVIPDCHHKLHLNRPNYMCKASLIIAAYNACSSASLVYSSIPLLLGISIFNNSQSDHTRVRKTSRNSLQTCLIAETCFWFKVTFSLIQSRQLLLKFPRIVEAEISCVTNWLILHKHPIIAISFLAISPIDKDITFIFNDDKPRLQL